MSELDSLGGEANDAGQPQEGNRPAQNARLTTPGHLSTQGYQGGDDAGDFLGLGAEVGASSAFELMADTPPEPEPEPSAWVDTAPVAGGYADELAHGHDDGGGEAEEEAYGHDVGEAVEGHAEHDQDEDLHGSWSESESKRGGAGKLVGVAMGVLVVGALGFVGMKFMGAAQEEADGVGPVAARPQQARERSASVVAPVEDLSGAERVGVDGQAGSLASQAGFAGSDSGSASDAEAARAAFEAERGDKPPAWFDPDLDSQAEPTETGWTEEAEAVTRASTFVGDPTALLAMQGADDGARSDHASSGAEVEEEPRVYAIGGSRSARSERDTEEEPASEPTSVVSKGSTEVDGAALAALVTDEEPAAQETPTAEPLDPEAAAVAVAASSSAGTAPVAVIAPGGESVGPAVPAGGATAPSEASAAAAHQESRASRTSTLAVEDVLLAPTMDSSNLRQADAKDLKGVWNETSVPMEALSNKTKVLTPNVGRVRVVLKSKDIFEGKLYAVGQGSVWLESQYGRISVDGKRIATIDRIDTKEGTPALGSTGSQNLAGLERVRVKTPGGTLYGKVISRDEKETTLITEDGAKLTLSNGDVEFLTDVPKVTIGGKVDEKTDKVEKKP